VRRELAHCLTTRATRATQENAELDALWTSLTQETPQRAALHNEKVRVFVLVRLCRSARIISNAHVCDADVMMCARVDVWLRSSQDAFVRGVQKYEEDAGAMRRCIEIAEGHAAQARQSAHLCEVSRGC
jgi:hypothetical protein